MFVTTNIYKDNIYVSPRQISAKAIFEIIDVDANLDASVNITAQNSFSKKEQITNLQRILTAKYATFEDNYFKLDGTFVLPPKLTEEGYEVGLWSNELSQSDGTFTNSQDITLTFTTNRNSIGLSIIFDTQTNEYADSFTITTYDAFDTMMYTTSITGNTLATYILEQNLSNYRKVVISITKWCTGNRRVRITEVDFGIIKEYTDSDIMNLDILEELDLTSSQITSNEIKLTLNNVNKQFNILNPNGIYAYLQRRQKLIPYYGLYINESYTEYLPMGVYYLTEWVSDEGGMTATLTARDLIDILGQSTFPGKTYTNTSLGDIIDELMLGAGIIDYDVDIKLYSLNVTGTLDSASYRDCLQQVAIAGMCIVYPNRQGRIQIKQQVDTDSVDTITYSNVYNSPKITLDKLINAVTISYNNKTQSTMFIDSEKPETEQIYEAKVENPLISDITHAQKVAEWLLPLFKKRNLYEINWRMNPALEVGDKVVIQDDYSANKTAYITKNDFKYEGFLSGQMKAKG